jgi:predicted nucleotidyltransferase
MDIYKEEFTRLEKEILNFLFANSGRKFNQRAIALALKVSPTAIANSIKNLRKTDLLEIKKDSVSETFEIGLNLQNNKVIFMKRIENLKSVYESNLAEFLFDNYSGATIVLFGSYAFGEDTYNSDIDIAIIGNKEKNVNLETFEKILLRKITLQFYGGFDKIHKNLKESILNGIILKGSVKL